MEQIDVLGSNLEDLTKYYYAFRTKINKIPIHLFIFRGYKMWRVQLRGQSKLTRNRLSERFKGCHGNGTRPE